MRRTTGHRFITLSDVELFTLPATKIVLYQRHVVGFAEKLFVYCLQTETKMKVVAYQHT